jgi:hypothetical protein
MIGADAVDPGINFVGIDLEACIKFGTGLGDALSFPGEAALLLRLGFQAESVGAIARARGCVHPSNVVLAAGNHQHGGAVGCRPEAPREREACATGDLYRLDWRQRHPTEHIALRC